LPRTDNRWNENTESLRIYQRHKIQKDRGSTRTKRNFYQLNGPVIYSAEKIDRLKGAFNKGS